MTKTTELNRFRLWLEEPAVRTGQIVVEAMDEQDATEIALNSLFAVDWDEQEVDAVVVSDVCRLAPDGEVDKKRIHELARERGYGV
jgi:hypothetical protein